MSLENALKPFNNEAEIRIGDDLLRLVVDFRMIDVCEGLLGRGMNQILADLWVTDELDAKHGLTGKVLWAMTRHYHPELTLDQVASLIYSAEHGPAVAIAAQTLLEQAFHLGAKEGKKGSRPPTRSRGASRPSSKSGSRRA